jgi:hypothetical protein
MSQIRYIMTAVLFIVAGTTIYLGFKKFEQGRCIEEQQQSANYYESNYSLNEIQADGKKLFLGQCASCHHTIKDGVGPALSRLDERGLWHDRKNFTSTSEILCQLRKVNTLTACEEFMVLNIWLFRI